MRTRSQQSGFSFIELLISMAVVVVLAAMVLGPTDAAARKKKLTVCAETMRKLHLSLTLYASEHDGAFPTVEGATKARDALKLLVPAYAATDSAQGCEGGGYAYAMGLKKGETAMLVADRFGQESGNRLTQSPPEPGNHPGQSGNVLFADGHVEQFGSLPRRNLPVPPHATLLNP